MGCGCHCAVDRDVWMLMSYEGGWSGQRQSGGACRLCVNRSGQGGRSGCV